jgi:hypothetical protein
MVNKYPKITSKELKEDEKPRNSTIQFLLNYSKSLVHKKGKKYAVLLIQN